MSQINQQENAGPIDPQFFIAKYLAPILENKWIVILCTLIGLAVAIPLSMLIKPEYSSTSITLVETPRAKMISKVTEEIGAATGDKAHITAEVERMYSSTFRTEVLKVIPKDLQQDLEKPLGLVAQLKYKLKPFIKKLLKKDTTESTDLTAITPKRLDSLSKRIAIRGNTSKGTIQITGTTYNQTMATVLVQSYLDVWVALNMDANKSLIRHELDFTQDQLKDYHTQLKNAENELKLFKEKFEIPPALTSVTDMELQSQLDVLQNKLDSSKERYKRIDDIALELSRKEKAVVNNIKVINPPQPPLAPSKNMKIPIILVGLLLGAATGIVPVLGLDFFRGNIRHKKDIFSAIDVPIIGKLPIIK